MTVIEQRAFLRGYQKLEIRSDGELEVTFKRFSIHNQFKVPLWHINPSPSRLKRTQFSDLAGVVIFGLCCLGIIIGMFASKDLGITAMMGFPLVILGLFFWLSLFKFKTNSINAMVFYYRNSNSGIHVWFNNPDADRFNNFCDELKKLPRKPGTIVQ